MKLVSDNSGNPELVAAARSFFGELREYSAAALDRRVDELAAVYRKRGKCRAGHAMTLENTQSIGKSGYRCRECRRKISRESARRRTVTA